MMDDIELDNERHRREEQERRSKRQKKRQTKTKSGQLSEKERKRREHARRILGAQKKRPLLESSPQLDLSISGGSSPFQSLFQERAEGFFIDLRFRNAPPRPPVGPTFVGLGLEGELTNKWTKYKARNAVETQYTWRLHSERELGVQLALSAMDHEQCYNNNKKDDDEISAGEVIMNDTILSNGALSTFHPEDHALINWEGNFGDTAAEQLQQKQDRIRASARLAIAQGHGAMPFKTPNETSGTISCGSAFRLKRHHLQSRILDEKTPNFMKKTTYLTNDATSVHRFTSLAHTQVQRAKDVDQALAETKTKYSEMDMIEMGFKEANCWEGLCNNDNSLSVKKKRVHPSKKETFSLLELPLLPDTTTWGHTYTHVVLDNPPKNICGSAESSPKKLPPTYMRQLSEIAFEPKQLQNAVVADVTKQTQNARMECTLWASKYQDSNAIASDSKRPTKKSKKNSLYRALQQYDLDVVPLRDPLVPPIHYVWSIDPLKQNVGYHCIGSRVHLSTGRPVVASGTVHIGEAAELTTDRSYVLRRTLGAEEKKILEEKIAEVDVVLAGKCGLLQENEFDEDQT